MPGAKPTIPFVPFLHTLIFSHLAFHSPLVPVLYHTSTPIIFCLSPPTTRHPVWEHCSTSSVCPWLCHGYVVYSQASFHLAAYFTHFRNRSICPPGSMCGKRMSAACMSMVWCKWNAFMSVFNCLSDHEDKLCQLWATPIKFLKLIQKHGMLCSVMVLKMRKTELFICSWLVVSRSCAAGKYSLNVSLVCGWCRDLFLDPSWLLMHFNITVLLMKNRTDQSPRTEK